MKRNKPMLFDRELFAQATKSLAIVGLEKLPKSHKLLTGKLVYSLRGCRLERLSIRTESGQQYAIPYTEARDEVFERLGEVPQSIRKIEVYISASDTYEEAVDFLKRRFGITENFASYRASKIADAIVYSQVTVRANSKEEALAKAADTRPHYWTIEEGSQHNIRTVLEDENEH